ncbi:MAG: aminotransferase class IV [Nitrospirae bacterium]|nr:aminotransferase class IV [Nitrospirota bacterium]
MWIHLNGRIVPKEEAKISVFDRGFLFGDGVFETLRSYQGTIFRCTEHLERLARSAHAISMVLSDTGEKLQEAMYETLRTNNLQDARIRIILTRGESEPGQMDSIGKTLTTCIIATPFSGHPHEKYQKGIRADLSTGRQIPPEVLNPLAKSLNRLNLVLARLEMQNAGADEALLLTLQGHVAEGTSSNVFMVKDQKLITPPLSSGILEGITRREIWDIARREGIPCEEKLFYPTDLQTAEECFVTSTTMEVMPVTNLGGIPIGRGVPGQTTRHLLESYRQRIQSVSNRHIPS